MLLQLSLHKVERWLSKRYLSLNLPVAECWLHGLLLVYREAGFIFIDDSDSPEEKRFTLAHEVAHFLYDYLYSRDRAQ